MTLTFPNIYKSITANRYIIYVSNVSLSRSLRVP